MNTDQLIAARSRGVSLSGIRRIFQLAGTISDPINLSIGQPDFPPPDEACAAARDALASGVNGYTMTQGAPALLDRVNGWLGTDLGWRASVAMDGGTGPATIITAGTSGALTLAFLCLLDAGDGELKLGVGTDHLALQPAIVQTDLRDEDGHLVPAVLQKYVE